jgi:hypothetical protein
MRPAGGLLPLQYNELEFSATRMSDWVNRDGRLAPGYFCLSPESGVMADRLLAVQQAPPRYDKAPDNIRPQVNQRSREQFF